MPAFGVHLVPLRSGLVNLPPKEVSTILNANIPAQDVIVELSIDKAVCYVGWSGLASSDSVRGESFVEIDPLFAKGLNIDVDKKVLIKLHFNPPLAKEVQLEPVSASDWEVVELHAQFLEINMISQIRAIFPGETITLYLSPTSTAKLVVKHVEPPIQASLGFAKLSPEAEVQVAPKLRPSKYLENSNTRRKSSGKVSTVAGKRSKDHSRVTFIMRGISLQRNFNKEDYDFKVYTNFGYLPPIFTAPSCQYVAVTVVKPPFLDPNRQSKPQQPDLAAGSSTNQGQRNSEDLKPANTLVANLCNDPKVPKGHISLSPWVAGAFGISGLVGHLIKIEISQKPLSRLPDKIVVHRFIEKGNANANSNSSNGTASLKLGGKDSRDSTDGPSIDVALEEFSKTIGLFNNPITNGLPFLPIPNSSFPAGGILELSNSDGWVLPNGKSMPLSLGNDIVKPQTFVDETVSPPALSHSIVGVDDIVENLAKSVRKGGGILLHGSRGLGKTDLLTVVQQGLSKDLIYAKRITAMSFAEERMQTIRDTMHKWFMELAWFSPSVLIIDDIDTIIPAETEQGDSSRTQQIAEIFHREFLSVLAVRRVSVLATCQSRQSVCSNLLDGHVFDDIIHLKSPSRDLRTKILAAAIDKEGNISSAEKDLSKSQKEIDLSVLAAETEGYSPADLWTCVGRAKHESIIRTVEQSKSSQDIQKAELSQIDFDNALKDFIPVGLRGIKLQKSSTLWSDIGGLKEAKRILLETLEWPTKYAEIFANSPLRLRSGLLLYGFPGCGKTLLASAVAKECGLNFITIKGPEILNKYIGASEQSVRDLFERAQSAKPCVLFFDEFDSIAPKRGHDSTGVTDRVVNQMLTQMDGAEGLDGVYVLAATSRPDLIDSALLRPGRLDKSILCDMPNYEDRFDIFQTLQTKMKLAPDVDLNYLATKTEGFSGADLQAVLYNAYLDAIHDVIDEEIQNGKMMNGGLKSNGGEELEFARLKLDKPSKRMVVDQLSTKEMVKIRTLVEPLVSSARISQHGGNNDEIESGNSHKPSTDDRNVIITRAHVEKSLKTTKSSISFSEAQRLRAIYKDFVNDRSGDMPSGTASSNIGGRTSLM